MRLSIGFCDSKMMDIYTLLYQMGIGPNQITFYYVACATRLVIEDPENLLLITKRLYPEVAKRCGAKRGAVEHGIRHAIDRLWYNYPDAFKQELGVAISKRPTPAEFLIMIARKVEFAVAA